MFSIEYFTGLLAILKDFLTSGGANSKENSNYILS
jgi:hypothetical protein